MYFQVEALWDTCFTDADIRKALANLPSGLKETYRRCLDRIGHQTGYAPKVLEWVSYAVRPLRIDELREAVAFDLQDQAWNPDKIPNSTSVIGCCANLVVLDATDGCVRFAHPSVKQYLEENQTGEDFPYPTDPEQGEVNCGDYCVAYLSFSDFGLQLEKIHDIRLPFQPPDLKAVLASGSFGATALSLSKLVTSRSDQKRNPILLKVGKKLVSKPDEKKYKFLDYAVKNWATQTKMINRESAVWNKFVQLAMNPNESWNLHPWIPGGRSLGSHLHGLLGWAVKENHTPFLDIILGLEYRDELRKVCDLPLIGGSLSALHVASRLGFVTVVNRLLGVCRFKTLDGEGCMALHHAAEKDHLEIVKLLSNAKGARVDVLSKLKRTPLWLAAINGHEQIVSFLLEKHASVKTKDTDGLTPLSVAALNGHEAIVKKLIEKGAKLGDRNNDHRTALFRATENGHEAIVKLFIDNEVDLRSRDDYNRTLLFAAAQNGHEAVANLLIDKGVDPQSRDEQSRTSLFVAAQNGHEAVVNLLIDRDVDPQFEDDQGPTPLFIAAENGHEAIVKLLIEKDLNSQYEKDHQGRTSLFVAAQNGHEAVVKLLADKDFNCTHYDNQGRTPLFVAAQNGHEAIVKLLIEKRVQY